MPHAAVLSKVELKHFRLPDETRSFAKGRGTPRAGLDPVVDYVARRSSRHSGCMRTPEKGVKRVRRHPVTLRLGRSGSFAGAVV